MARREAGSGPAPRCPGRSRASASPRRSGSRSSARPFVQPREVTGDLRPVQRLTAEVRPQQEFSSTVSPGRGRDPRAPAPDPGARAGGTHPGHVPAPEPDGPADRWVRPATVRSRVDLPAPSGRRPAPGPRPDVDVDRVESAQLAVAGTDPTSRAPPAGGGRPRPPPSHLSQTPCDVLVGAGGRLRRCRGAVEGGARVVRRVDGHDAGVGLGAPAPVSGTRRG